MRLARLGWLFLLVNLSGCAWAYPPSDPKIPLTVPAITDEEFKAIMNSPSPEIEYIGEPIKFIHPKVSLVMAPMGTELPIQVWVKRDKENRELHVTWCSGSHAVKLEGDQESQIQPIQFLTVHVPPGKCEMRAATYGPGGRLLRTTSMTMNVCGSPENPCGDNR